MQVQGEGRDSYSVNEDTERYRISQPHSNMGKILYINAPRRSLHAR
jgi:hypothetical protein